MKTALIAIDPTHAEGKEWTRFCKTVETLQSLGLFSKSHLASVIHSDLYAIPHEYYRNYEDELAREAKAKILGASRGKFEFRTAKVLKSQSSSNEELVAQLSKYGKRLGADILVLGSNDRQGFPYWLLGSVSETASLTASLPVLVIKSTEPLRMERSHSLNIVIAIDVNTPPKSTDIRWLVDLARSLNARAHLVYVMPDKKPFIDRFEERKDLPSSDFILKKITESFHLRGVSADYSILPEAQSIGQTIVAFAEKKNAWFTITTTAQRTRMRRLLLGSNARQALALTKRPFLSYRPR